MRFISQNFDVVNYLFLLQLKARFHNLVYLHGRALSSQLTPHQVPNDIACRVTP